MVNLDFTVIGVNDVTTDPTVRFKCVTSDGEKLYIGTDRSVEESADVWEYSNGNYTKITDNLASQNFYSVETLLMDDGKLFAGVGGGYTDGVATENFKGQVWVNNSLKWVDAGISNSDTNSTTNYIRSLVKVGDDIYAGGSRYDLFKFSPSGPSFALTLKASESGNMPPEYDLNAKYNTENWIDLETDGSAVYGAVLPIDAIRTGSITQPPLTTPSSIVKYDGASLIRFSPNLDYGNGGTRCVSKLHYDDGYLYAGTYNSTSGTEVWRSPIESGGGTWTRINTPGFGDFRNFVTKDIKTLDGHIVVSVQGSLGGQLWAYDKSDSSWTRQTVNSDVVYEAYYIQRLGTLNYLVGQCPQYFVQSGDDTLILSGPDAYASGLPHLMDNSIASYPLGDDRYRFFTNNGPRTVVTEGTLENPFETIRSPLQDMTSAIDNGASYWCAPFDLYDTGSSSTAVSSFYFQEILDKKPSYTSGYLDLNGSGFEFRTEDNLGNFLSSTPASAIYNYAYLNDFINKPASGQALAHPQSVLYDADEDLLLGTLYCEEGKWGIAGPASASTKACGPSTNFLRGEWHQLRSMRLMVSNDKGLSFSDCGSLILPPSGVRNTPNDATSISATTYARNVGPSNGAFQKRVDPETGVEYLYVYFCRFPNELNVNSITLGVARAPYSSVISYALNGSAYPFSAYHNGSWDQVINSEPLANASATELYPPVLRNDLGDGAYFDQPQPLKCSNAENYSVLGTTPTFSLDPFIVITDAFSHVNGIFTSDGVTFGYPQKVIQKPLKVREDGITNISLKYLAHVGPSSHLTESGDTFNTVDSGYTYTTEYGSLEAHDSFWQTLEVNRTSVSAPVVASTDRSFETGRYIRAFNSKYAIDRGQLPGIYAAMHRIGENKKLLNSQVAIEASTSSLEAYLDALILARSFEGEDPNDFAALTAEINRIQALLDGDYRSYTASGTNSNTAGYTFPASVNDYYNFEFGRDLHRLYHIYHENFQWHRLSPDVQKQDGANIFSHTFGPLLYNHDFEELGSVTTQVASSFANPDKIDVTDTAFTGPGSFVTSALSSLVYVSSTSSYEDTVVAERTSSGVVEAVELVLTSGTEADSSFSIIKVPGSQRASYEDPFLFDKTLVLMRSGVGAASRLRFDISKYDADSTHPITNNFLSPEHEFKVTLSSLISRDSGATLGGRSVGVWIHTKPEDGKMWSFTSDGEWTQHDQLISRQDMLTKYSHTKQVPLTSRNPNSSNSSSTTNYACLDQVTSNRNSPVMGLGEQDFSSFEVTFNTRNRNLRLPRDYQKDYNQLHRLDQNYVIEVFMAPGAQPDEFMLVDKVQVQDLTMKKLSEIFAAGTKSDPLCVIDDLKRGCLEYRVELTKQDLFDIFKHFNNIAGKNAATAYASRDKTKTETIMESEGGSRIDYRLPNGLLFDVADAGSYYTQVVIQV
jgi:hypothetical protein